MFTAYIFNGLLTIVLAGIFVLLTPWMIHDIFDEPQLTFPLIIALISLIPQTFSRLFSAGINGFRKIWQKRYQ